MRIPSWTVNEMLAEKPCEEYTRKRLEELWAGRERLTLVDILDLDIPETDKIWVCCRDTPLREPWLSGRVLTRCISNHALNCGVPQVCEWAQRWLRGEDHTADAAYTASAANAAYKAAFDAAADAYTASAAAHAAYAAHCAADAAHYAHNAPYAAANAAHYAADAAGAKRERERQVRDMREVIAQMCEGD